MKKYLVDVYLPAAGCHYDTYLPARKKIGEVVQLLARIAGSLSGESYTATADAMLFDAESGEPFRADITVFDAGIRSSSKLILI